MPKPEQKEKKMKLNSNAELEKERIAYVIIGVQGKMLHDIGNRLCYTTKSRAREVAKKWGIPNNVQQVKISFTNP